MMNSWGVIAKIEVCMALGLLLSACGSNLVSTQSGMARPAEIPSPASSPKQEAPSDLGKEPDQSLENPEAGISPGSEPIRTETATFALG
jgi:hypothetical protein